MKEKQAANSIQSKKYKNRTNSDVLYFNNIVFN
jgi:hypothetical protein